MPNCSNWNRGWGFGDADLAIGYCSLGNGCECSLSENEDWGNQSHINGDEDDDMPFGGKVRD